MLSVSASVLVHKFISLCLCLCYMFIRITSIHVHISLINCSPPRTCRLGAYGGGNRGIPIGRGGDADDAKPKLTKGETKEERLSWGNLEPTFISGGQWGPRASLSPSRTPPVVAARTINPSPCPLARAGQSSSWPRPFMGAGRDSHCHAHTGPALELTPPPPLVASRHTEAAGRLQWPARQAGRGRRQGGPGARG